MRAGCITTDFRKRENHFLSESRIPHSRSPQAVSIVVPVCNERDAIAETLHQLDAALRQWDGDYEIIVVVNGSTDGSADAVRESGVEVILIEEEKPKGYGGALKIGFAEARYDWFAFLDADGSYPPAQLPTLIQACGAAEMAVGQRDAYNEHSSWARRLGKSILVPLANYLTRTRIPDINSGMRVVSRRQIERYWPLLPDGFSLTTTITMAFLCSSRRIAWLPIQFEQRKGESKIRPLRDMRNFIILILRTATYFRPLRVYAPLSGILVLLSLFVVFASKLFTHHVMDVTALFLFIAGLQVLVVGVVADLVLKLLSMREHSR
jgi:glycosyltransferase involved in cell wall biosynthesis